MRRKNTDFEREALLYMSEVDQALYGRGRKAAYVISGSIFLMLAGFLVWANFAMLDEVTRGIGKVIPSRRVQEIQNLEGGILNEIFVIEGQRVQKGTLLCRLSNEQAASFYRDAAAKEQELKVEIVRLLAEVDGVEPDFGESLTARSPQLVKHQMRIYRNRRQQLNIEVELLTNEYEQKKQEISEMSSRLRQLRSSLRIARRQRDIAKPLVAKQIHSELDYLSLEQKVTQLKGDVENLALSIPRARSAAAVAYGRIKQRKSEFKNQALKELNEHRQELASIKERLAAGGDRVTGDRVTRTDVQSPVNGIVKHILINTVGGVVQPGQSIMEVVPLDSTVLVEAKVKPADIAFVHPGQKGMVKITAYDFAIYGGLEGKVEHISADTIIDERGDSYYLVKVRTNENALKYQGEELPILPGMMAQVDLLAGKKSVLDYLLKPILKAKQNALRER